MNEINDIERACITIGELIKRFEAVSKIAEDRYIEYRTLRPSARSMRGLHSAATQLVRMRRLEDRMYAIQGKARAMAANYQQMLREIECVTEEVSGFENEVKL